MRMLVLGAGQQGSACAYDLLTQTDYEVVLADSRRDPLPEFLEPFADRLERPILDARDASAVREVMRGASAVMSALPYYLNLDMCRAALEAGAHFCDLGGNTDIVFEQKKLHEEAVSRRLSIIPDCGLAPGMVNILAEHGIRQLDRTSSVRIKVGGLPENPQPPLNYQVVYSLEGVLDYYTTESWILRNGEARKVRALSEIEEIDFPEVGRLEAFHTAGGLSTMAHRYEGRLDTMEYKTLRYPGHAEAMRLIRELGLLSLEPVDVKGTSVVPRDAFIAVVEPTLKKDPQRSPDLVALQVEVQGMRKGKPKLMRWELLDRYDPNTGITAMMRTTGFSLAITGLLQAEGDVKPGVGTPDEVVPAGKYVQALGDRGVDIRYYEDVLEP